jgi:hypothetical protein
VGDTVAQMTGLALADGTGPGPVEGVAPLPASTTVKSYSYHDENPALDDRAMSLNGTKTAVLEAFAPATTVAVKAPAHGRAAFE